MSTDTGRRPIHKYMVIFLVLNHYGYVLIGQKMTPENPVFDDLYGILDPRATPILVAALASA